MIGLFDSFIEGWRDVIGATWPETIPNGIREAQEALQASYLEEIKLPCAIIDVPTFPVSNRDGLANTAWRPRVEIYYVMDVDGDSSALRQKMEALNDYLQTTALAVGQLIPRNMQMACGRDLEANSLLIMLNATQRAGQLSGICAVGTTGR